MGTLAATGLPEAAGIVAVVLAVAALLLRRVRGRGPDDGPGDGARHGSGDRPGSGSGDGPGSGDA